MKLVKSTTTVITGVACLLLVLHTTGRAQSGNSCSRPMNTAVPNSSQEQDDPMVIKASDVVIISPGGGQFNLSNCENTTDLTPIFGKPDRITDFYAEMESSWWKKWFYPGAYFLIDTDNKMLDSFHITGPGFKLSVKGTILEVGKPIDELAKAYPDFNKYIIKNRAVALTFQAFDGELTDEFLEIQFDPITRNIKSMKNGMP